MKTIIFKLKLKDLLTQINYWRKLEEPNFETNKVKISISDELKEEENFPSNTLTLEFFIGRHFMSYGKIHEIYELTEVELENEIRKEFKVIHLSPDDKLKYDLAKKLIEAGYDIIPVDNKFYIRITENTAIMIHNTKYISEDI